MRHSDKKDSSNTSDVVSEKTVKPPEEPEPQSEIKRTYV